MQAPECIEEASHSKEISAVVLRQCDRTISLERAFRLATSTQELTLHHPPTRFGESFGRTFGGTEGARRSTELQATLV
jgi:hypothetical protein